MPSPRAPSCCCRRHTGIWGALACWASGVIPFAQVAASCARQGPNDGRQAGVAIICPSPPRIVHQRE
eukprot:7969202-Lingulodinium_polyedra.AAC.1